MCILAALSPLTVPTFIFNVGTFEFAFNNSIVRPSPPCASNNHSERTAQSCLHDDGQGHLVPLESSSVVVTHALGVHVPAPTVYWLTVGATYASCDGGISHVLTRVRTLSTTTRTRTNASTTTTATIERRMRLINELANGYANRSPSPRRIASDRTRTLARTQELPLHAVERVCVRRALSRARMRARATIGWVNPLERIAQHP